MFLATVLNAFATVMASVKLHRAILHNLLRVPTSFYDVTPLGAIINRVGKVCTNYSILLCDERKWCVGLIIN